MVIWPGLFENSDRPDDLHHQADVTIPAYQQVIFSRGQEGKQNLVALAGLHREDHHPAAIVQREFFFTQRFKP